MPPKSNDRKSANGGSSTSLNPLTTTNVYLYVPNLIGYARILFAFAAFRVAFSNPLWFIIFYLNSQLWDAFDGYAARLLNQSSQFGAVLDMVTDRFSTMILCAILACMYPLEESRSYGRGLDTTLLQNTLGSGIAGSGGVVDNMVQGSNSYFLQPLLNSEYIRDCIFFFMVLDIVSHWYHMYSSLLCGSGSHKNMNTKNPFIRLYYTNRIMLFTCCACQEFVWLMLYVRANADKLGTQLNISGGNVQFIAHMVLVFSFPLFAFKQFMNFLQGKMACDSICDWEKMLKKK